MSNVTFPGKVTEKDTIALVEGNNQVSYGELHTRVNQFATGLLAGRDDLNEERIAILIPASLDYVTALHGVWCAGGIALPLGIASTAAELEYYLSSTGATRLVAAYPQPAIVDTVCELLNITLLSVDDVLAGAATSPRRPVASARPEVALSRRAMILYTSGTTDKPKGVVLTHNAIHAQIKTLVDAWEWRNDDVIPLFLPLHHIHGIINILNCALWRGATVHLMPKMDVPGLCTQVAARTYSLFMAVPTIYVKLIKHVTALEPAQKKAVCDGFASMRLTVSGSAACPVKVFEQWQKLTGQVLLERYGMTEVGMAISNPYKGERRAGFVGQALPGVRVQLFDDNDAPVDTAATPGEIRIKSDHMFLEYWNNAAATRECFRDGWFCTGDIAVIEDGYFRIMGRASVDIIKSGGYKLSALEIESVLLTHNDISEVAVIGVPDETWGEAVVAVVTLRHSAELDLADLRRWCRDKMSAYKIPRQLKILDALPRNAMGKVTKPALANLFQAADTPQGSAAGSPPSQQSGVPADPSQDKNA